MLQGYFTLISADTAEKEDAAFAAIKLTGLGRVEFLVRFVYVLVVLS